MENLLIGVFAVLGAFAYILLLVHIIVDMCNPNPYMTNWEFIKECLRSRK